MTLPVYILDRTPGAEGRTVAWTDICSRKLKKIFITHSPFRDTSRWKHVERKRPFIVYINNHAFPLSSHKTLAAAEKAAYEYAKESA